MNLTLKIAEKNYYSKAGILIKSSSVYYWLQEIQRMNLSLNHISVYAIPSQVANDIYGCLITLTQVAAHMLKNAIFMLKFR